MLIIIAIKYPSLLFEQFSNFRTTLHRFFTHTKTVRIIFNILKIQMTIEWKFMLIGHMLFVKLLSTHKQNMLEKFVAN